MPALLFVTGVDCLTLIVLSTGGVLYCLSGDLELDLTLRIGDGDLLKNDFGSEMVKFRNYLVGETLLSRSSRSLAWEGLGSAIGDLDLLSFSGDLALTSSFRCITGVKLSGGIVSGSIVAYSSNAGCCAFSAFF